MRCHHHDRVTRALVMIEQLDAFTVRKNQVGENHLRCELGQAMARLEQEARLDDANARDPLRQ